MTFEKLHADIKEGCDCVQYGSDPDGSLTYYRRGDSMPATEDDFLSLYEKGKLVSGTTCKEHCHHRGVSMYQITIDLAKRKEQLKAVKQFTPKKQPIAYFVRIRTGAGLVWSEIGKDHCELLKSDGFCLDLIEFVDVFDTSNP
jgi:hypothetical protein